MRLSPGNSPQHHPLLLPLVLVAAVLAVYYPALYSSFHPIDDSGIVTFYSASPPLVRVLLPGSGYYYRPLVELSYYLDNLLWGMEPAVMHLENILLHCANSLLLLLLARRVLADSCQHSPLVPFFAALLFALHPVNVEAVAWVAGRTDPLMALFLLSSLYFWLRWLDSVRWPDLAAALLLFGAALLTKETAFAFGAVLFLLALTWPGAATVRQRWAAVGVMAAPALLLIIGILLARGDVSGLSRFISGIDPLSTENAWNLLAILGFYVRKLLVPVPLNFAIIDVHPGYGLAGLLLGALLWWLLRRCRPAGMWFVSALLMMLPALLIAMKQVAWTPVAERYLYFSSALCVLGLLPLLSLVRERMRGNIIPLMVLVAGGFAVVSAQRTLLWQDQRAFFQDAIAKSPAFGSLYNELGNLLLKEGELQQAEAAFVAADRLNRRDSMRLAIKANLLAVQYAKGNYPEVREQFFRLFKAKQDAPADFLELLYRADNNRLALLSGKDRLLLAGDLLETLELLDRKRPDPFWWYQSGQLLLGIGDRVRAVDFFRRAHAAAPTDAHYRNAAEIWLRRLK